MVWKHDPSKQDQRYDLNDRVGNLWGNENENVILDSRYFICFQHLNGNSSNQSLALVFSQPNVIKFCVG